MSDNLDLEAIKARAEKTPSMIFNYHCSAQLAERIEFIVHSRDDVLALVREVEKLREAATKWGQALLCLKRTAEMGLEDHSPTAVLRDIGEIAHEGFYETYPVKGSVAWTENLPEVEAALVAKEE